MDWSHDVFPKLLQRGAPIYGYVSDRYWEDVGTLESYLKAQADVLNRKVEVDIAGFELSPGVWVAEGADVDPDALLKGPLCVGEYAKIEAGATLREYSVIGANVVVKEGAFIHRAVVHNRVFVGQGATLRGCVVGKNTDVMRRARIEESAVIGDECVIEPEAYISAGVKVYPFKTIEAGAVVNNSVIWESRGQRTLFGERGVSGLINVEVTPELAVRLASAYATTLRKGSTVTTSRDVSRAARTLKRAVQSALNASAINVMDLEALPLPVARFETARRKYSGGVVLRTTPGDTQSVDIIFLDERGAELSQGAQRKLERVFSRQEFRRAFPGEIAELSYPPRVVELYTHELLRCVNLDGVGAAGLKVVADCAGGTVSLVLPTLLGGIGVDVHTLNNRLDEVTPTQTVAQDRAGMQRLAEVVSSSRAAFGVRFDPVGERIHLVDEKGALVSDERALLVVLDLVAAELRRWPGRAAGDHHPGRRAGLPVPRRAGHLDADLAGRADTAAAADDVIFAADGRGGFVVPEFGRTVDGIAGVRQAARPGRADPADAEPDRRAHPAGAPDAALGAHPVGGQGVGHADRLGGGGQPARSTPPTACGSSTRSAAGSSCCPTRRTRSRTCGRRAATPTRRSSCSTSWARWWNKLGAVAAGPSMSVMRGGRQSARPAPGGLGSWLLLAGRPGPNTSLGSEADWGCTFR